MTAVAPPAAPLATRAVSGRLAPANVRTRRVVGLAAAVGLLALAVMASVAVGAKSTALTTVLDAFTNFDPTVNDHLIIRSLRLPRTATGVLIGAALGVAGAVMQGVTRNTLADPGVLGINAGAALFVVIAIYWFGVTSLSGYVWFAFAGAATAAGAVYLLGTIGRDGAAPVKLALAGAALTALAGSAATALLLVDMETLDQFRFWAVGSLAGRGAGVAAQVAPFIVAGLVFAVACGRRLNALALGDDVARSLGQRVGLARAFAAVTVVLLAGAATAAAGPIVFVGLTVPHVARAIVGPDYRWIIPYSAVLAATLLLVADVLGRVVARPDEIQVGIVTALIGAPFFISLVRRRHLAEL